MRYIYILSISAIFSSISRDCWIISCSSIVYRCSASMRLHSSSRRRNSNCPTRSVHSTIISMQTLEEEHTFVNSGLTRSTSRHTSICTSQTAAQFRGRKRFNLMRKRSISQNTHVFFICRSQCEIDNHHSSSFTSGILQDCISKKQFRQLVLSKWDNSHTFPHIPYCRCATTRTARIVCVASSGTDLSLIPQHLDTLSQYHE